MSYGNQGLKNQGHRTPRGKSSWEEFEKEVQGNIRHALNHMTISEYREIMIEVLAEQRQFKIPSWMLNFTPENGEDRKKLDKLLAKKEQNIRAVRKELNSHRFYPVEKEDSSNHLMGKEVVNSG